MKSLVEPSHTALDLGCGMGFFNLPLVRRVGPNGRVIAMGRAALFTRL